MMITKDTQCKYRTRDGREMTKAELAEEIADKLMYLHEHKGHPGHKKGEAILAMLAAGLDPMTGKPLKAN